MPQLSWTTTTLDYGATTKLGYDAIETKGRRKSIPYRIVREDAYLSGNRRDGIQANASDLTRNYSIARWMIGKHLDYVSTFAFHSRTGNDQLDTAIEALMEIDGRPENFDVAGKFSREKAFRMAELRRIVDGDTFLVKLGDGRIQMVQADLCRNPSEQTPDQQWIGGVLVGQTGRPLLYNFHVRVGLNETKQDRSVVATNVVHYGFFDRYSADQIRGVSPIASALNDLRDCYEAKTYALAKMKVAQLFGLVFSRNATDSAGTTSTYEAEDADSDEFTGYKVDFGQGPFQLDMNPGDQASFLESKTPSAEFQAFLTSALQMALKALDIPYSFYDESHTNYSGSRSAALQYDRSCLDKRADQIEMRRKYTVFKLQQWIRDGRLVLPRGWSINDLRFEWVARGVPYFDPTKEISAWVGAVAAGLATPQQIAKALGTDFYENVDQIAEARNYATSKGVDLSFAQAAPPNKTTKRNANG